MSTIDELKRMSSDVLTAKPDECKHETYRDVRVEWHESFGEASRSLDIESHMTFEEMDALVNKMLNGWKIEVGVDVK